jgi:hypothetical protein
MFWGLDDERNARIFLGATSALVTFGLVLQIVLAVRNDAGLFESALGRLVNTLSYFTVQSNILAAVTTGMLAWKLHRPSTVFRVLRLAGLVGIAITGVVFHLALKDLQELQGKEALADFLLHTASPILCVLGWLLFGPRGQISKRLVGLSVLFPVLWLAYTLVRGALVQDRFGKDYYPYPFLDVVVHGYGTVAVNIVLVAVLFLVVAGLALLLDRHLPGVRGPVVDERELSAGG